MQPNLQWGGVCQPELLAIWWHYTVYTAIGNIMWSISMTNKAELPGPYSIKKQVPCDGDAPKHL